MIVTLLVALVGAVVSLLMAIVMWKVGLKYRLYPAIRDRDVHTRPTPRLGGIAMYIGLLAALLVASQIHPYFDLVFQGNERTIIAILCAATLIVVMGVLDDFFDLDWTTKLIGQVIAAGLLAWLGGLQITQLPVGKIGPFDAGVVNTSSWSSLALTLVTVVVVMNMMNFIDGLDGLVAGVAVIANGTFFLYAYMLLQQQQVSYFSLATLLSAVMMGVCLGFLPLNWHPAKLFMGDAGSLLVGLMFAVVSINLTNVDPTQLFATGGGGYDREKFATAFLPLLLPIAIMIVPVLDFTLAVVRRILAGKSPFSADRQHLHHRLLDMGHSRLHATLIFYAWTAVLSVGALLFYVTGRGIAWSFIGGGLVVCAIATLAPLSHRKRREFAVQVKPVDATTREIAVLDPLDRAGSATPDRAFRVRFDSITTVLRRALVLGAVVGLGVGLVTGLVGLAVAGGPGLASGLVGAALTIVFLGVTAAGVLAVGRLSRGDGTAGFAILMGGWFVKLALFVGVMVLLRGQPWVVPGVLLASIVGTVLASLVVDAVVVGRARIPVTERV